MRFDAPAIFNSFARDYDRSRHRLVPDLDRFYGTVAQVMALQFADSAEIRVLDLGAGTGLLSAVLSRHFPRAQFVLADAAPQMLERARERFASERRFEFLELDFGRDTAPHGFDCVVSALAIHHMAPDELEALFRHVLASLNPNGLFVNADQTRGASERIEEAFEGKWQRDCFEAGSSRDEVEGAIERMKADRQAPLEWQLDALRKAGFADVECFYKRFRFAVYAGWRPSIAEN